jgi:hypothetical protein
MNGVVKLTGSFLAFSSLLLACAADTSDATEERGGEPVASDEAALRAPRCNHCDTGCEDNLLSMNQDGGRCRGHDRCFDWTGWKIAGNYCWCRNDLYYEVHRSRIATERKIACLP